jgi:TorA maturation chaperone TorD
MGWDVNEALSRSACYKLLSLAFLSPSTQESGELWSAMRRVSEHLPERHRLLLGPLLPAGSAIPSSPSEREHDRLFGVGRCAPPYETEYDPLVSARKGHVLADLLGFYEAFGFRLAEDRKEFPDHLAVELEFMSCLLLKAVYAAERSLGEAQAVSEHAAARFLGDHLAAAGCAVADRVEAAAEEEFYRVWARLLKGFLSAEAEFLGVPAAPRAAVPEEVGPLTCPFAPGCHDVGGAIALDVVMRPVAMKEL